VLPVPVSKSDYNIALLLIHTSHLGCHQFYQRPLSDLPIHPSLLSQSWTPVPPLRKDPAHMFLSQSRTPSVPSAFKPPLSQFSNQTFFYLLPSIVHRVSSTANANSSTMPQLSVPTSAGTNPDIVQGPCKRRPTEHVIENGDPLARKKAKMTPRTLVNTRAIPVTPQTSIEEISNVTSRPQHLPPRARQSSGATYSSEEDSNVTHTQSTIVMTTRIYFIFSYFYLSCVLLQSVT
jgi:hypothetical protein